LPRAASTLSNWIRCRSKDAVAALAKESGFKIDLQGGNNQIVSLEVTNVTFWEAFDRLCLVGGLVLQQHYDNSNGLMLYAQNSYSPHVDHAARSACRPSASTTNKALQFATLQRNQLSPGQRSEQLSFMFNIVAEPRLPLLGLGTPKLTYAVDDNDGNLMPPALTATPTRRTTAATTARATRCSRRRCSFRATAARPAASRRSAARCR